ncbi:MAG: T9SS type A sorting domain-containing protein [Bacteroidota bacterium]
MKKRILFILFAAVVNISAAFALLTTPVQVSPTHGAIGQNVNAFLDWNTSVGASWYEVKVGTSPTLAGASLVNTATNSYYYCVNLFFNTTYYWSVRAKSASDSSAWSIIWQFTTMDAPTLVSPANNAVNQNANAFLDWNSVSGITNYDVEIDTNAAFNTSFHEYHSTVSGTDYYYCSNLHFGQKYYWRARARHATDTSSWTSTWAFRVMNNVTLVSPANNAVNQNANAFLDWNSVTGITNYDVELDTSAAFNTSFHEYNSTVSGTDYRYCSNLRFGQKYYWRARARHATDTTAWSATWAFRVMDGVTLSSPTNNATNLNANAFLDWNSVTGITNYDVELDTSAAFNTSFHEYNSTVSGTDYRYCSNLRFGQKYYWRARARHATDTTAWSPTWAFRVMDGVTLSSPTNNATNLNANAFLDWNSVSGITNYDVELDTSAAFNTSFHEYNSTVSGTDYRYCSNLRFGQKYYWRARARHAADTTTWSATWAFRVMNNVTLSSPTNNATNLNANAFLDWNSVSGITNYDVEIDTSAAFNTSFHEYHSTVSGTDYYYCADLQFGQKYYWRARARHAVDTTVWSPTWAFTVMNSMSLVSPTNNATSVDANVYLDWSAVSGITNYDAEFDTTTSFNSPLHVYISTASGVSGYTTSNLRFETKYYWRARSRHSVDTTVWSAIWNFTTRSYPGLVSPANGATGVSLNLVLDWNAVNAITNYHYEYSTDPAFSTSVYGTTASGTSQVTAASLSYGTTYYWRVRCAHAVDTSAWSAPWSFTTLYQLTTPVTLSSPANSATGVLNPIVLQWQTYATAIFYEYMYDVNSSFTAPVSGTTTQNNINVGNFPSGTTYYWKVRANNGSGYSPWSTVWNFTMEGLGTPILVSPANGATAIPTASVLLNWDDASSAAYYVYEYDTDILFPAPVTNSATISEATISGLALNTTYFWRVRSHDGVVTLSPWSTIWQFTTETGIGIEEKSLSMLVYPNPATDFIFVETNNSSQMAIEIMDITGSVVLLKDENYFSKKQINVSGLTPGTYLLRITDGTQPHLMRFIKM